MWVETFLQDLRYAVRSAKRTPFVAAAAVLTLGLGIGVNTALFSVLNTVLLRQPAYTEPERLVAVRQKFPKMSELTLGAAPAEFVDYRDRNRVFSSIAGYEDTAFDLTGGSEPVRVPAQRVTHTLFSTLGVAPFAGRVFLAEEDEPGFAGVAVLSYEFWQRHFGGRADMIGTAIRLNERPHTVIGVMPAGFEFPFTPASVGEPPALWVPMAFTAARIRDRAAEFPVNIVARLRSTVSLTQAEDDVVRIASEFQRERSDIYTGNLALQVSIEPLGERTAARVRPVLVTLAGAVVFVLLIACANVTNLLLARAAIGRRDMAVRSALGASRSRLVAQHLAESLFLTTGGVITGCMLAQMIITMVSRLWPSFVAGLASVRIDATVLVFTITVSIVTGVLCGLVPALSVIRPDLDTSLKQAGRQGKTQMRLGVRRLLVVLESASAVVLLVGAGLLVHSFVEVLRVPIGFSPEGVLIARTTFNRERYPSAERRRDAQRLMIERLQGTPGVSAVGLTTHIPLADARQIGFILEGEDIRSVRWADNALVSDDYFRAMGIPLLRGRTFGPEDRPDSTVSAVVNDSMARRYWPNGDALGRRLMWGGRTLTIVGIAGDVHVEALDTGVNPTIYTSVFQVESGATRSAVFVVRAAAADRATLATQVRDVVSSVDRGIPVFDIRPMSEIVSRSLDARRFALSMLSAFSLLALALAVIGLYGLLSYAVTQRTAELGVRLALGATPRQVLHLVASDGLRLTAMGILIGGCAGAVVARSMSHLLYGITAYDPATYGGAVLLLLVVATLATVVPARRASRVDPVSALRAE
jgi:predicted permease